MMEHWRDFKTNEYLQVPFPSDILIDGCFKTYFREIEEGGDHTRATELAFF
jgi:hypothetical protein